MTIDASLFMRVLKEAHGIDVPEDRAKRVAAIADTINAGALKASDDLPFDSEASHFIRELERD